MVFNATFNNISVISWRSVLLVAETGGPGENQRLVASYIWFKVKGLRVAFYILFLLKIKRIDYFVMCITIDFLHIPNLILKLQGFTRVISLSTGKMVSGLGIAMELKTNLSVIFT